MLILESRGPLAGSQRPPFPPASEVHVGKPAPDRQNSQVGSPQPCATRPARLQPRPLLPPSPLRGRKPPGLPSLPPTPQARSHLRAFARSAPLPGAPFPQTVTRLDASHLPSLSRIGTSSETFSKEALLRALGVFNSLHSMRRSHTLPDLLISSLLMSSARADAEESREACSPQGPPHLEDTQ